MAPQPEWFEKDYYKILGVAESASQKEITSAYRKLARELHPDANPGDAAAEERFKEVSAAYDVVGDEAKRKEYDEVRKLGPVGAHGRRRVPRRRWRPGGGFTFSADDLGDLLRQPVQPERRRRAPPAGPRAPGPSAAPTSRPSSPWTSATPWPASRRRCT